MKPIPCPFCGAAPEVSYIPSSASKGFYSAFCDSTSDICTGSVSAIGNTKKEALRKWNTRRVANDQAKEIGRELTHATTVLLRYLPRFARNTTVNVTHIRKLIVRAEREFKKGAA